MENVLITGVGMVGAQVAHLLIERYKIRPILFDLKYDMEYLKTIFDIEKAVFIHGNILDKELIQNTLSDYKINRVLHLAAVLPMRVGHDAHPGFYEVNSWGTANLLFNSAEAKLKRFVMTSTNGVYQFKANKVDAPISPDFPTGLTEHNSYGNSKAVAEYLLRELVVEGKLDAKILRPGEIYGPVVKRGINEPIYWKSLIDAAIEGRPFKLENHPEHRLDWVYAKDVAEVAVRLLMIDSTPHISYHATKEKIIGIYDWKNMIDELFPDNKIELINCAKGGWEYPLSMKTVKDDLNYVPKYDLKRGILDYVKWKKQLSF
jgi:nucleoside-diphosphate-sugar epimerase